MLTSWKIQDGARIQDGCQNENEFLKIHYSEKENGQCNWALDETFLKFKVLHKNCF